jgi:DNA-binding transcriptional regulator YdaS (Cro superfamily)
MKLDEYLSQPGVTALGLANKLSVPSPLLSQWRTGARPIPIERCPQIEQATNGEVTRKDLRPDDWQTIWPELDAAA